MNRRDFLLGTSALVVVGMVPAVLPPTPNTVSVDISGLKSQTYWSLVDASTGKVIDSGEIKRSIESHTVVYEAEIPTRAI